MRFHFGIEAIEELVESAIRANRGDEEANRFGQRRFEREGGNRISMISIGGRLPPVSGTRRWSLIQIEWQPVCSARTATRAISSAAAPPLTWGKWIPSFMAPN
jgi:hypothetical protein